MNGEVALLRGIYVVLDASVTADLRELLRSVLAGGARVVQYRAKSGIDAALAADLSSAVRRAGGLFIVNDNIDVARSLPGAGLHLGQEDLATLSRSELSKFVLEGVVGISCGTPEEARMAGDLGATYIGVGPFAETATKLDAGPAIGEAGLAAVARSVAVPTVAIGGIGLAAIPAVVRAGAAMAAVVSAIASASDPVAATRALVDAWEEER